MLGTRNVPRRAWVWRTLLAFCHFNHDFAHDLTSVLIRSQTNLSVNRRIEAFAVKMMAHTVIPCQCCFTDDLFSVSGISDFHKM